MAARGLQSFVFLDVQVNFWIVLMVVSPFCRPLITVGAELSLTSVAGPMHHLSE